MPSWLREERRKREEGKQWGREKSGGQITPALGELQAEGGMCVWVFLSRLHVNSKRLTLLELIPIKSLQRAAVCQSLTPSLICWHPFSSMRKNSRQTALQQRNKGKRAELLKHITLDNAADCQTCLQPELQDVWEVKATETAQKHELT